MKLSKLLLCLSLALCTLCPVSANTNDAEQKLKEFQENMLFFSYLPQDTVEFENKPDNEILTVVNGFAIKKYMLDENYILDLSKVTELDYIGENNVKYRAAVDAGLGYGDSASYHTMPSNANCAHVTTAKFYNYSNDTNPIEGRHDLYLVNAAGWRFLSELMLNDYDLSGEILETIVNDLVGSAPFIGTAYTVFSDVNNIMSGMDSHNLYLSVAEALNDKTQRIHLVLNGIGSKYEAKLSYVEKWNGLSYATYSENDSTTYVKSVSKTYYY